MSCMRFTTGNRSVLRCSIGFTRVARACAALAMLGACGAGASYVLPVSGAEASAYYPAILQAAQEKGAQAYVFDDHAQVRVPEGGWVFFYGGAQRPSMQMVVKVPDDNASEVPARTQAAKALGDAIWNRALELRKAAAP
jgi:hypothetical protein